MIRTAFIPLHSVFVVCLRAALGRRAGATPQVTATIPVGPAGGAASAIAIHPATHLAYMTNWENDNLTVVNADTCDLVATIPVGGYPRDVAVNPVTNRIYVAVSGDRVVRVLDGTTHQFVGIIDAPACRHLAVNAVTNRVYVSNELSHKVNVHDGKTGALLGSVSGEHDPAAFTVDPVTNRVYFVDRRGLWVLDGASNTIIGSRLVSDTAQVWPNRIAVNPSSGRVYTAWWGPNWHGYVDVLDGATLQLVTTLDVGYRCDGLAVDSTTNRVYAAAQTLRIYDGATNTELARADYIAVPGGPTAVVPGGNRVCVACSNGRFVAVNGTTGQVLGSRLLAVSPSDVAANAATHRAYSANYFGRSVSVIDLDTYEVINTIEGLGFPDAIAVNPATNRVYVADEGLCVIDGATDQILAHFSLDFMVEDVAVNPVTNRVYVVGQQAQMAVVDGNTNQVLKVILMPEPSLCVAVDTQTNRVYVPLCNNGGVLVVDGSVDEVSDCIEGIGNGRAVGIDESVGRVYVAEGSSVCVIEEDGNQVLGRVSIDGAAWGVAVDATRHRVYVTDPTHSKLVAIDGMAAEVLATADVPHGPEGIAFAGKICVASRTADVVSVLLDTEDGRPDLTLVNPYAPISGGNVGRAPSADLDSPEKETLPGVAATYYLNLRNIGGAAASFRLRTSEGTLGAWGVIYKLGDTDISSAVRSASGWVTPSLAPGEWVRLTVSVTPPCGVLAGTVKGIALRVYSSATNKTAADSMVLSTRVAALPLGDLLVKSAGQDESAYGGDNRYLSFPSGDQVEIQNVVVGASASYSICVQNDGTVYRTYTLKAKESGAAGWTAVYRAGGTDITDRMRGTSGYTTLRLAPGARQVITVAMTPSAAAAGNAAVRVSLYHDASGKPANDAVALVGHLVRASAR